MEELEMRDVQVCVKLVKSCYRDVSSAFSVGTGRGEREQR